MPPERGLGREADRVRRVRVKSVCVFLVVVVGAQKAGIPHAVMARRIRIKTHFQFTFSRAKQQLHMKDEVISKTQPHTKILTLKQTNAVVE